MKKLSFFLVLLTGLGLLNRVSAQADLDVVNLTGCTITVDFSADDGIGNCGSSMANPVPAGSNPLTLINPLGSGFVFHARAIDFTSVNVQDPATTSPCSVAPPYPASGRIVDCSGAIRTVTFTPATAVTNAVLTIL